MARSGVAAVALAASIGVGGCSYALEGRVVRGETSMVEVVGSDDPRLDDPKIALSGVGVNVQADPNSLHRKTLGRAVSGRDGEFRVAVDEFGAGITEFSVGVFARKKGYEPAEAVFQKPGGGRRVLVTMTAGQDKPTSEQADTLREEFGDQLLK